jgi:hypothetical protein
VFRQELMGCFARRPDALFELAEAVPAAGPVVSLPHLSLDPLHRRGHRCSYVDPPPAEVGARGRPRRHGTNLSFAAPRAAVRSIASFVGDDR